MNTYLKWGIGAAICGGAVAGWYLYSDSAEEVVSFRTVKVSQGDFVVKVQATGTLEPVELVDVGAQVTGKILELGRVIRRPAADEAYDPQVHDPEYMLSVDGKQFRIVGYPLVKELDTPAEKPSDGLVERKVLLNGNLVDAQVNEATGQIWVGEQTVGLIMVNAKPVVNGRPDAPVVDYASEVEENQLLARIDDELVKLAVERAEASVKQAEAGLKQAEASLAQAEVNKNKADRDLARAEKLGVGDALSQMDYDQYVTSAENAEAQLASARAQKKTAEAQLVSAGVQHKSEKRNEEYTLIVSPIKGSVIVRQVNVGQTVVSSMNASTLFLVAKDLSKMQIWTSVNEADIAKVESGQEVRFTVDALPNESFVGQVNKVRPNATMSSNVVTYIVEVDLDNPKRKLRPYLSANANFIVRETKNCLLVQDAAFDFVPEEKYVAPSAVDQLKQGPRPPKPPVAASDDKAPAEPPAMEPGFAPARLWRVNADNLLEPVVVLRGESDGTRSIVKPMPGQELAPGTEFVTGAMVQSPKAADAAASKDGNSPFGMKRPERRQRSAGGVDAKPGQNTNSDRPGPPM